MRALIRQRLVDDVTLQSYGIASGDHVVSGQEDSITLRPFINLQWAETTTGLSVVRRRGLVVWVHDEPNDYTKIDQIVSRVRTVLTGLEGLAHTSGWLVGVEWETDSSDLSDDARGTILRQSRYIMVGSGI